MTRRRAKSCRAADRRPDGAGLTAFALRLAKHLEPAEAEADGGGGGGGGGGANLVFSPLSIYAALALVAAGAGGGTLQELLDALGARSLGELAAFARRAAERALADRSRSGGPAVAFSCGVWHDASWALRPAFRAVAAASFKAQARAVDFRRHPGKAIDAINGWVAAATNNLIDSIVDSSSVNAGTSLVLGNAIYFNGRWAEPFAAADTIRDRFYRLDGSAAAARFMSSTRSQLIAVHDGYKVLKLPYRSSSPAATGGGELPRYAMCVFLPDWHDGLPALVDRIAGSAGFRRDNLPSKRVPVGAFRLPRFRLAFSGSMKKALKAMGIRAVFDDDADLSGMAKCDDGDDGDAVAMPLFVSDVRHKAVLEVNEEGTVAAAATVCEMRCTAGPSPRKPPETVNFVADHPFVFFVIEEVSGAIVFVGQVLDPSSSC
ncbi:hypothetical protein ACP4OV_014959 [Aristida adscensionis]